MYCFNLQRSLSNTEDECSHLKEMCDNSTKELQQLAEKHEEQLKEMHELQERLTVGEKLIIINNITTASLLVQKFKESVKMSSNKHYVMI